MSMLFKNAVNKTKLINCIGVVAWKITKPNSTLWDQMLSIDNVLTLKKNWCLKQFEMARIFVITEAVPTYLSFKLQANITN